MYKTKILFFGMPDMALVCLSKLVQEELNIVGVVPPHRSDPTYNLMCQYTNSCGLNIINYEKSLDEPDFLNKIKILNADVGIVCSYNRKFPPALLNTVKGGIINCHPSLLPEYRGGNPYSNVILNGEKETGITLHYMDENFDTGNIIWQRKVAISPKETMGTLFNKQNYIAADMIAEYFKKYETNPHPASTPQPQGDFKKAPVIDNKNYKNYINWENSAEQIERFVRALNPFISAMATFRGIFVKIYSSDAVHKKTKYPPGSVCYAKDVLGVSTGDGILEIKTLQFGSYMITDAKEFINTFKPQPGETLG